MHPERVDHTDHEIAAALVGLQHEAYAVEAAITGIEAIPPLHETALDLAARSSLTVLACFDDGGAVAMIGYDRDGGSVTIDRLAVAPSHFRCGLGRALVVAVHEAESDAGSFRVSTGKGNTPAAGLYSSMGYTSLGYEEIVPGIWIERFELTQD